VQIETIQLPVDANNKLLDLGAFSKQISMCGNDVWDNIQPRCQPLVPSNLKTSINATPMMQGIIVEYILFLDIQPQEDKQMAASRVSAKIQHGWRAPLLIRY
jgi:hypothetical protein